MADDVDRPENVQPADVQPGDVPSGDEGPVFPLRDMLGFTVVQGDGTGTATLEIDERHINPHGTVHGGVMFVMLDTAMGA
ncbi:MAG: PaaI family thioesterase, partial [Acidimicrobiia bacterium]